MENSSDIYLCHRNANLQTGHVAVVFVHVKIHPGWKKCPHRPASRSDGSAHWQIGHGSSECLTSIRYDSGGGSHPWIGGGGQHISHKNSQTFAQSTPHLMHEKLGGFAMVGNV